MSTIIIPTAALFSLGAIVIISIAVSRRVVELLKLHEASRSVPVPVPRHSPSERRRSIDYAIAE